MGARRQGDAGTLESMVTAGAASARTSQSAPRRPDARLGEAVEIAKEVLRFRNETGLAQEIVKMLSHRERQE